ncbi:regulator of microtubule dynamics protein 3-like isoform X1 [Hypanus sabinus]|uniref:regulator of microtubule dynamics protein 3-like isoform X1 n=2 Tax=Hypanus sabinus TaxID=79690 RepID=UPI0028C38173|nr:regulator of microtubule dynamics protein 3-like isoform X1 [Hypanus sabinus]
MSFIESGMSEELIICKPRISLGLGIGAVAGFGLMYLAYTKGWGRRHSQKKREFSWSELKHRRSAVRGQEVKMESRTNLADNYSNNEALKAQQVEIWEQLDIILQSVRELKEEVIELRECLNGMTDQIANDVRSSLERCHKVPEKKTGSSRERSNSVKSNSIYFTANTRTKSNAETESEEGYTTANGDSDYECGKAADEQANQKDPSDSRLSSKKVDEFFQLLCIADSLHEGTITDKAKGLKMLLKKKSTYNMKPNFCWRLARAYLDMEEMSINENEKISYLDLGKEAAKTGLQLDDSSAECHKWYAIISGQQADHDTTQNRIKAGYTFKEHIDKAIKLKNDDPSLYYLLGRWCYEVAQLGWIERKAAATFYGTPPRSTIDEALKNFLKAEELNPGYSKSNSVYIAKCYRDLGNNATALHWLDLASELPIKSKDDTEAQKNLEAMRNTLVKRS